jgi:hypothetical protein
VAAEADVGTKVAVASSTDEAVPARVGRLDDDAFAGSRTGHDDAAHLVAQHERLHDPCLTDAAVLIPVEVGAAQADGGDADELLSGRGDGLWFLVDTDVGGAVQSKHFHANHDTHFQCRSRLHGSSRAGDR